MIRYTPLLLTEDISHELLNVYGQPLADYILDEVPQSLWSRILKSKGQMKSVSKDSIKKLVMKWSGENEDSENPIIWKSGEWKIRELNSNSACALYAPIKETGFCTGVAGSNHYQNSYGKDKGNLYLFYKGKEVYGQLFVNEDFSRTEFSGSGKFFGKEGSQKGFPISELTEQFPELKSFFSDFLKEPVRIEIEFGGRTFSYTIKDGIFIFKEIDLSHMDLNDLNSFNAAVGNPFVVTGGFYCHDNNLTSLEGAPEKVVGGFYCSDNPNLTSLEGAPKKVGGNFYCRTNPNLTSLEGAPKEVGRNFDCSSNKLTSLEGAPKKVGGDFYCYKNPKLPKSEIVRVEKIIGKKIEQDMYNQRYLNRGMRESFRRYKEINTERYKKLFKEMSYDDALKVIEQEYPGTVRSGVTPFILKKIKREMSLKYHPDITGGSDEKMKEINDAIDSLSSDSPLPVFGHHPKQSAKKKKQEMPTAPKGMMVVELSSIVNEDRDYNRGYEEDTPAQYEIVGSFGEARDACRRFIDQNDLGGSNWTGGKIYDDTGNQFAYVSYNGRVWRGSPMGDSREEIKV